MELFSRYGVVGTSQLDFWYRERAYEMWSQEGFQGHPEMRSPEGFQGHPEMRSPEEFQGHPVTYVSDNGPPRMYGEPPRVHPTFPDYCQEAAGMSQHMPGQQDRAVFGYGPGYSPAMLGGYCDYSHLNLPPSEERHCLIQSDSLSYRAPLDLSTSQHLSLAYEGFESRGYVVDSILRGVEIGGIAPRRRPRAVKQDNKEQQNTQSKPITSGNQTPLSRSQVSRKSRTPQQQQSSSAVSTPGTPPAVPSPVQEPAEKTENKSVEKSNLRQRPQVAKDRKRKIEVEHASEEKETKSSSPVTSKRRTKCEEASKPQTTTRTQASVKTENPTASSDSTPQLRVSPRNTPAKEKVKLQKTREIDKREIDKEKVNTSKETAAESHKNSDKPNSPLPAAETDSPLNRGKSRSRQKREEKSDSAESPRSRTETLRQRNDSPRSRSSSQTPTQEAESVIKPVNKSGSTKPKDKKSEKRDTKKVSNCAKKDRDHSAESSADNTSSTNITGKDSSQSTDGSKEEKAETSKPVVENKAESLRSRESKDKDLVKPKENKVECASPPAIPCEVKPGKTKEKRKGKDTTQADSKKCAGKVGGVDLANTSKETENSHESGDMHFIKKKQSLLSGSGALSGGQNKGIPTSNIDFNQSVTDQIARAEKLSHLNGDDRLGASSVLSSGSEQLTDLEHETPSFHKDIHKQHRPSSVNCSSGPASACWSQDERSHSRNSEERCSSGFSDELRRPNSRLDELKSSKSSPASSPLIVDKKEPVQIYRDPVLMSKNPVRSNVPSMHHNSHKTYSHTVHNPIPTQATRSSSVGMSSTPITSGLERSSRTPVIPSATYVNPLPIGASHGGAQLAGLLPHGLPQMDPTLVMQQFAAVQQQQVAAALASQYGTALSMSYPPRGSLNSAQLEHLWQQKYPHVPVPPPWLLAKHQDDLIRDVRLLHEQELEREHIERMERLERERERDLREREQRERKERERRERERQEKERIDRANQSRLVTRHP